MVEKEEEMLKDKESGRERCYAKKECLKIK